MESINKDIQRLPIPTEEGVKKFLSSPYVKGIGKVYADKIVAISGIKIIDPKYKLDELSIPGLTQEKINGIKESLSSLKCSPQNIALLYSAGLSDSDVEKILAHYGRGLEKVLLQDPYEMVENVWKLSFFTADKIGKYLNIPADDPRRLAGALLTAIKIFAENGNMFASEAQAIGLASKITGVDFTMISKVVLDLISSRRAVKSMEGLYLPVYYNAEKEAAEKLAWIINNSKLSSTFPSIPDKDIYGNPFTNDQKDAISTVLENPVSVITGGPGTGKSTTIRGLISLFTAAGKKIILAAPTGRAAKRISELTGEEAKTIHRLLGYSMGKGYKNKKLEADILILDEASMLEQVLFNHLLQAIDQHTKVVLVGDPDQLPAIGAGNVLKDMIESSVVPVVTLKENFRQNEGSAIAATALSIKEGEEILRIPSKDFVFLKEDTVKTTHDRILSLFSKELPAYTGLPANEILLVTPQQEGPLGAKQLNSELQELLNPNAPEIKRGIKKFRLGDKVMQTVNSSQRGVYNGEIGVVTEINLPEQSMIVKFGEKKTSRYNVKEISELSLAYATTVHKLQGSEADYIVLLMSSAHKPMLYRNLLYTGVSRAKKLCVIIGDENALVTAIATSDKNTRNSNFKNRLEEGINRNR